MKRHWTLLAIVMLFTAAATTESLAAVEPSRLPTTRELVFAGLGSSSARSVYIGGYAYSLNAVTHANGAMPIKSATNAKLQPVEATFLVTEAWMLMRPISDFSAGQAARVSTQYHMTGGEPTTPPWTDFGDCLITRAAISHLDANEKGPVLVDLTLQPSQCTPAASVRAVAPGPASPYASLRQPGSPPLAAPGNGFVVSIPGVDTKWVTQISPIVISTSTQTDGAGRFRLAQLSAGQIDNENFVVRSSGATARSFQDWLNTGVSSAPTKRDITIQCMDPTNTVCMLTLHGTGLGILSVKPVHMPGMDEGLRSYDTELFVERWTLTVNSAKPDKADKLELAPPATPITITGRK